MGDYTIFERFKDLVACPCGGELLPRRAFLLKKEGQHRGGIYYMRFSREELRSMLESPFNVEEIESCLGKLLIARGARKKASLKCFAPIALLPHLPSCQTYQTLHHLWHHLAI